MSSKTPNRQQPKSLARATEKRRKASREIAAQATKQSIAEANKLAATPDPEWNRLLAGAEASFDPARWKSEIPDHMRDIHNEVSWAWVRCVSHLLKQYQSAKKLSRQTRLEMQFNQVIQSQLEISLPKSAQTIAWVLCTYEKQPHDFMENEGLNSIITRSNSAYMRYVRAMREQGYSAVGSCSGRTVAIFSHKHGGASSWWHPPARNFAREIECEFNDLTGKVPSVRAIAGVITTMLNKTGLGMNEEAVRKALNVT